MTPEWLQKYKESNASLDARLRKVPVVSNDMTPEELHAAALKAFSPTYKPNSGNTYRPDAQYRPRQAQGAPAAAPAAPAPSRATDAGISPYSELASLYPGQEGLRGFRQQDRDIEDRIAQKHIQQQMAPIIYRDKINKEDVADERQYREKLASVKAMRDEYRRTQGYKRQDTLLDRQDAIRKENSARQAQKDEWNRGMQTVNALGKYGQQDPKQQAAADKQYQTGLNNLKTLHKLQSDEFSRYTKAASGLYNSDPNKAIWTSKANEVQASLDETTKRLTDHISQAPQQPAQQSANPALEQLRVMQQGQPRFNSQPQMPTSQPSIAPRDQAYGEFNEWFGDTRSGPVTQSTAAADLEKQHQFSQSQPKYYVDQAKALDATPEESVSVGEDDRTPFERVLGHLNDGGDTSDPEILAYYDQLSEEDKDRLATWFTKNK